MGNHKPHRPDSAPNGGIIYTNEQRQRRDESRWTLVQGILAPAQFVAVLVSLYLVLNFLKTGTGLDAAIWSVLIKTALLYAIMITGSLWEKDVFGQFLFVKAFFWEDVVSMLVMVLHTAYVVALLSGLGDARIQMYVALIAYIAYVINAAQYIVKFRMVRRTAPAQATPS